MTRTPGLKLLVAIAGLAAVPAVGQLLGPSRTAPLGLAVTIEKLVAGTGGASPTIARVPPALVTRGDQLVYTVSFTNPSAQPTDQVRITSALPSGVRYVPDSASGPGAEVLYSADGGATFGEPDELTVLERDGSRRAAAPVDYTHIRWLMPTPLEPGATGFVRFRAVAR